MCKIVPMMLVFSLLYVAKNNYANNVVYQEDDYALQAPEALVSQAEQVAQKVDFQEPYELAIPKQGVIQKNPWNNFISFGTNPESNRYLIVINPEWFKVLRPKGQEFLLGTAFVCLQKRWGVEQWLSQEWWMSRLDNRFLWSFLSLLITFLLALSIGMIIRRMKILNKVVLVIIFILSIIVILELSSQLVRFMKRHLLERKISQIHRLVINRLSNQDLSKIIVYHRAATSVLALLSSSVHGSAEKGEAIFEPFKDEFDNQATRLRNDKIISSEISGMVKKRVRNIVDTALKEESSHENDAR